MTGARCDIAANQSDGVEQPVALGLGVGSGRMFEPGETLGDLGHEPASSDPSRPSASWRSASRCRRHRLGQRLDERLERNS